MNGGCTFIELHYLNYGKRYPMTPVSRKSSSVMGLMGIGKSCYFNRLNRAGIIRKQLSDL
jgi:hypothetical protein